METGNGLPDPGRIKSSKNKLEDGEEREQGPKRKKISEGYLLNSTINGMDGKDEAQAESTDPKTSAIKPTISQLQEEIETKELTIQAQQMKEQQRDFRNIMASFTKTKAVKQDKEKMDGKDEAQAESTDPKTSAIKPTISQLQEEIETKQLTIQAQQIKEQQHVAKNIVATWTEKKTVNQDKEKMDDKDESQAKSFDPDTSPIQPSISQLQEEIDTKQLTIQAQQFQNHTMKEQQCISQNTVASCTEKEAIEQYKKKVQEYQLALNQRDHLIGQLQSRLAGYVQQQDELQADNMQQAEMFKNEIETLKLQLKETVDSLSSKNWLSGVNPREHIQLKNKLISMQQDREQDQEMIKQLTSQLAHKDEKYNHLEYRYKHCLQKLKQAQVDNEKLSIDLQINKASVERLQSKNGDVCAKIQQLEDSYKADLEKVTSQGNEEKKILEKQNKILEERVKELEEEIRTLQEAMKDAETLLNNKLKNVKDETDKLIQEEEIAKEEASSKIQSLMQQIQELNIELAHTKEQHQTQLTAVEEQFGKHLTVMKQQMSDSHSEELSRIKASHESELAQLTQQIDALEKAQKEDQAQFENLISVSKLNISLKEQLEGQKEKIQTLECSLDEVRKKNEELRSELEIIREEKRDLELRLKQELDTNDGFKQKLEEQIRKNMEVESMVENLKKEALRLNEVLKVETENRFTVENKLAMELQNMKDLSEEKKSLEEKLEKISNQISVMSNELAQSKASKEELNNQFQKTQQRYNEIVREVDSSKKIIQELELICEEHVKEKQIWITEKEKLTGELKECIIILKDKITEFEKETKIICELRKEISLLKKDKQELSKRCDELVQFEQQYQTLTEELALVHSDLKKLKAKHDNIDKLREKYLTLIEHYNSGESKRKEMEEECKQKCESLNDSLKSLDSKLAAASSLTGEYQEISHHNVSLEKKFHDVIQKLKEAEENTSRLEEALMKANLDNEALVSELEQTKIARDSMEKEKNECETERDRMLEQYKMMKAELASTLLALDREVQLSTHQKLTSDIGISVSTSTSLELNANQKEANVSVNEQHPEGLAEKDVVVSQEGSVSTKVDVNSHVSIEGDKLWEDKISNLEKKNKELLNEIEKLKTKVHHQNFGIKSLENEKSTLRRRISELESEKAKLRADQEKYQKEICEKVELHQQLEELKLRIHVTEDNLKRQEEEMDRLRKTLKAIIQGDSSGSPEKFKEIVKTIETSAIKPKSGESLNCTSYLKNYLSNQSEELQCMCEELKKYLCELLELLHHSDLLYEEKLQIEMENIALKVEVEKLTYFQSSFELNEAKSVEIEHTSNEVKKKANGDIEEHAIKRELQKYRYENEKLRLSMEKNKILLKLENLRMQSSRLNSQKEVDLAMEEREMITAHVGKALEKLIEGWEDQAMTEPALASFISAQSCKVCDIIRELSNSSELSDSKAYVEAALRLIRQAIVKNVSGQYLQVVISLLAKLDQDITKSIEVTLPKVLLDTSQDAAISEGSTGIQSIPTHTDEVKDITNKVEHLINARTTLVDAANDIEEQLEEAVASRMACIRSEIDSLIKVTASASEAKENEVNTKTSTSKDVSILLESHQHFIDEFLEVTNNIYQEAQSEKLKILKNQKMMVHKILEDNKAKLHTVCERYIEDLKKVASLSDGIKHSSDMVTSLENTLSEEVTWVEQQYKELLEQYSYEQNLHMHSHSLTLEEVKNRLIILLKSTSVETKLNEMKTYHESEINSLKEEHAFEIHRLESQLAARDQETLMALDDEVEQLRAQIDHDLNIRSCISNALCSEVENIKIKVTKRHLQSLYSDRDWYKKTVGLLSHVTLQLLHYYSVAENYTHKSQDDKVYNEHIEDHCVMQQPELSSGKVLDLSFLSDYMPEDNDTSQLNMFTEDSALSTGLIGKAVYPDQSEDTEITSNSGSVLDSTAMSEGMLDDVDKDEQIRSVLTKSYPQLMSILKGRWDRVVVESLEKEVQELTISLQASAGMLKIFMHSAFSEKEELSSHTIREEIGDESVKETITDVSQPHLSETSQSYNNQCNNKQEKDTPQPSRSLDEVESGRISTSEKVFGDGKKQTPALKNTLEIPHPKEGDASMENQPSHSQLFKQLTQQDLDDLSESLSHLLNQDDSLIDFTALQHQDLRDGDKLKAAIRQLFHDAQLTESLQMKLHHVQGLLKGLENEKKTLEDEIGHLNHLTKSLAMELQIAKDQIEESKLAQQGRVGGNASSQYAARMEASKDIKERVRATLSAKDKSSMDHMELVTRVGDLEGILEVLVRENDAIVEELKSQVSDLSQQLEVADRQLRSSRQFLEEHATDRDQEMEELMKTNESLMSQLREKEALITQHANLEKEVENLERQLREKSLELQETLSSKEEIQVEHKAAVDKIWDLREIIQSLEAQVDGKCVQENELSTQIETLKAALTQAHQHSKDLTTQLEELRCEGGESSNGYSRKHIPTQGSHTDESGEDENAAQLVRGSLFKELNDECGHDTQNATGLTLLQIIGRRLERTTRGLEALQLSISSASQSAEDLSIQDNLDVPELQDLEVNRTLSPSTVSLRIEDKLLALECAAEAAVKHTGDLEMTLNNIRLDYEEVTAERDVLQERLNEQLVLMSSLEARLDEMRRSDHPMAAELRQRLTVVQEDLEKKRNELTKKGREIEELKHTLSSTRRKLMSREEELKRMQSVSQPHSLPQTISDQLLTKHRQLEEDLQAKNNLIECLKKELIDASKSSILPTSLAQSLIEDKNAEIGERIQELMKIKSRVSEVITFITDGGNLTDTQDMLQNIIGRKENFCRRLANRETSELLRKSSAQPSEYTSITISDPKDGASPLTVSSGKSDECGSYATQSSAADLTLMSVQPDAPTELSKVSHLSGDGRAEGLPSSEGDDITASKKEDKDMNEDVSAALHTSPFEEEILITKKEYENLCSASDEVTVLRVQIELLQKEISSINIYQARLEEDYKAAQEMLESREAEIIQLSEEIEDSVPQPLPSETLQMQDRCFRLEEQVMELQEKLSEAATINREYEQEIEKLSLRIQQADQEIQEFREKMKQTEDLLDKKEAILQETRRQIETKYKQDGQREVELRNELRALHEQLEHLKQEHVDQSATLQRKNEEVAQLSTQLDVMQSQLKQRLSHTNREVAQLEQQYQQEISDMKEEQILREKQLCSDYEERMAAQVGDLSVKLGKEKEEAIARQQHLYESALCEMNKEKECVQKKLQEQLQTLDSCNRSQQTTELCASVDALNAGVKQELDKSGQLDNSLVSFVKHGQCRGDPGELSTRASSAVSDVSDGDEPSDVANKVQKLMNKIHEEGIEMLTLIELMFLQKHHTHLDMSQRSLISRSGLIATGSTDSSIADVQGRPPQYGQNGMEGFVTTGERTQLLRHMASLEEELSKKDQEMKRKIDLLEFTLEQEKMSGNDWKLSYEGEKKRAKELMDQLRQEKLAGVDQVSELTLLRSQLFILELQLQKIREENSNVNESLENNKKELETVKGALQAERNNFSRVSKVLNQQRHLSAVTRAHQDNVIKELRITLDKEREKIMILCSQLAEATSQQPSKKSSRISIPSRIVESERITSGLAKDNSTTSKPVEDLQMQLAVEQERYAELQRLYERERLKAVSLNEQAHAERAHAKVELMEEQEKCAELTKTIWNMEMEKETLMRQMSHDQERLLHQDSQVRELEGKVQKLEGDLRAQADAHQVVSHRVREEDAQLHVSYTRTLNKLGEAEAEVCSLRHKIRTVTKELDLAKEREEQLQKELSTEKMAINRLGLPALARINNLDEYFELQLKENLELCKSVLRLTDDRQLTRKKIINLENTITNLTEQLVEAKSVAADNTDIDRVLQTERSVWEAERESLQRIITQKEAELRRLQAETGSRTIQNINSAQLDEKVQYVYGKYIQSEHWRKALIWQKRYLLGVISGYRDNEENALSRLDSMVSQVHGSVRSETVQTSGSVIHLKHRFRVGVLVVIAVCRMKILVQKYRRKRRLGTQILFPFPQIASDVACTPEAESSRPGSSISATGATATSIGETRPLRSFDRDLAGGVVNTFTGQTPPTRGPTDASNPRRSGPSSSCRSLFIEEESPRLNEYIERLDNIHSALGLNPKNI